MYSIPLYKQKLYALVKETYNLKSNAQAGQKIRHLLSSISIYSFWSNNPLKDFSDFRDIFHHFRSFFEWLCYQNHNFCYLLRVDDNHNCCFANDYIKLLFHIYYNEFFLN